jgi:hypothetical protein
MPLAVRAAPLRAAQPLRSAAPALRARRAPAAARAPRAAAGDDKDGGNTFGRTDTQQQIANFDKTINDAQNAFGDAVLDAMGPLATALGLRRKDGEKNKSMGMATGQPARWGAAREVLTQAKTRSVTSAQAQELMAQGACRACACASGRTLRRCDGASSARARGGGGSSCARAARRVHLRCGATNSLRRYRCARGGVSPRLRGRAAAARSRRAAASRRFVHLRPRRASHARAARRPRLHRTPPHTPHARRPTRPFARPLSARAPSHPPFARPTPPARLGAA